MDRFLVQVSKDIGYANIMEDQRYKNDHWTTKPRDAAHGEVKAGDELIIYCNSSVPGYKMSIPFSVVVDSVSADQVTFELKEPSWFPSPLKRAFILELIDRQKLPIIFRKCGQQGFNITKLDPSAADQVLAFLNQDPDENQNEPNGVPCQTTHGSDDEIYTIGSIIDEGSFLDEARLTAILSRMRSKKNVILQGPPGTGKTWLAKKLAYALIGRKSDTQVRSLQFHPSMAYEDFVRGYRPGKGKNLELIDGPFLKAVDDAKADPQNDCVLVIEEINRGNPAQIFGEMLTLL